MYRESPLSLNINSPVVSVTQDGAVRKRCLARKAVDSTNPKAKTPNTEFYALNALFSLNFAPDSCVRNFCSLPFRLLSTLLPPSQEAQGLMAGNPDGALRAMYALSLFLPLSCSLGLSLSLCLSLSHIYITCMYLGVGLGLRFKCSKYRV